MGYTIKKCNILKCYILWEEHTNYSVDLFHGKLKRDCKEYFDKVVNKNGKNKIKRT